MWVQAPPSLQIPIWYTKYMRTCKVCSIEKPIERFEAFCRKDKIYYKHTCKDCKNARARKGTKKILFDDGINKMCGKCEIVKSHNEFANKKGKPSSKCKSCHNEYYKQYYSDSEIRAKHQQRVRENKVNWPAHRRHGLTEDEFNKLKTADGLCPICSRRDQSVIDHNHRHCPGVVGCRECVRGYICSGCNSALGNAGDSVEGLMSLIEYLTRTSTI